MLTRNHYFTEKFHVMACLLWFTFHSFILPQNAFTATPQENNDLRENQEEHSAFFTARHLEPWGIGYERGYSTLEGLFFPYQKGNFRPLIDTRVHGFTNNEYAANQGVGVRYFSQTHQQNH